eukprot:3649868-Rhodomonas_salina.4
MFGSDLALGADRVLQTTVKLAGFGRAVPKDGLEVLPFLCRCDPSSQLQTTTFPPLRARSHRSSFHLLDHANPVQSCKEAACNRQIRATLSQTMLDIACN